MHACIYMEMFIESCAGSLGRWDLLGILVIELSRGTANANNAPEDGLDRGGYGQGCGLVGGLEAV